MKRIILIVLKSIAVLLLLYLFLDPVRQTKKRRTEKPVVVIAHDNSASVTEPSPQYKQKLKELSASLSKDYDLQYVVFGSKTQRTNAEEFVTKLNFKDFATDIAQTLNNIYETSNRNFAAAVLLSDGIVNMGENPLNTCEKLHFPVITVALGDTTHRKDLFFTDIRYNRIVYKDNSFPLEMVIGATNAKGNHSVISVKNENNAIIFRKDFSIDQNDFSLPVSLVTNAEKSGIQRFTLEIQTVEGEKNIVNNRREIFVEVLDSKEKILLLAASPHPDIAAIRRSLELNRNYEVSAAEIKDLPADFLSYSLIILHQLPSNTDNFNKIRKMQEQNIPLLFVLGSQTNLSLFNSLATGISVTGNSVNTNQSVALYNTDFSLFSPSKATENLLFRMPPLICPSVKIVAPPSASVLAYQKIGNVNTNYPLIAFYNSSSGKTGLIAGENIWKWRLQNYALNQTHAEIDEILQKSVKLVANKIDKSRFRIIAEQIYNENQPIVMEAEVYDENYELNNNAEVSIEIRDSHNKAFRYTFGKTDNAYRLNIGQLQAGKYQYAATTVSGGKNLTVKGSFVVSEENLENLNLTADHSLLYNISAKTSGRLFYPSNMQAITDYIKNNEHIKPVIYESTETKRLISEWWYWLIILLLLSVEWGLRKYWGNQ
ncbi:MAG: hypothetical protein LBR17_07365 [Bacteroidales bacterium]|nr:hypothetical protein [Bacteroidales bacterium]